MHPLLAKCQELRKKNKGLEGTIRQLRSSIAAYKRGEKVNSKMLFALEAAYEWFAETTIPGTDEPFLTSCKVSCQLRDTLSTALEAKRYKGVTKCKK